MKLKNVINKHKSNKITENSNTVRHLNNGTDHRHSKSCCDQSSPARRTIRYQVNSSSNRGQAIYHFLVDRLFISETPRPDSKIVSIAFSTLSPD